MNQAAQPLTSPSAAVICEKCRRGTMMAWRIERFSTLAALCGYVLMAIGALPVMGAIGCGVLTVTTSLGQIAEQKDAAPAVAGAIIGAGISGLFALGLFMAGLLPLVVGIVLVQRKSVWRCSSCGYIYDRT